MSSFTKIHNVSSFQKVFLLKSNILLLINPQIICKEKYFKKQYVMSSYDMAFEHNSTVHLMFVTVYRIQIKLKMLSM